MPHVGASVLVASALYAVRERIGAGLVAAGFDVAWAADIEAAVRAAERLRPDLCLVDGDLPGGGAAAVARILGASPAAIVLTLSFSDDDDAALDSLEAGASGCVLKDVDPAALSGLVERALAGEPLLRQRLTTRLVEELRERRRRRRVVAGCSPGVELTRREWQVLGLLARHLTTAEIAAELVIEPVTVRTHVASILRKLHTPSRQAALRLFEAGRDPRGCW